jgi:hypothetical protein
MPSRLYAIPLDNKVIVADATPKLHCSQLHKLLLNSPILLSTEVGRRLIWFTIGNWAIGKQGFISEYEIGQ